MAMKPISLLALLLTAAPSVVFAQSVMIPYGDEPSKPAASPYQSPDSEQQNSAAAPSAPANPRMKNIPRNAAAPSQAPQISSGNSTKGELPAIPGMTAEQVRTLQNIYDQIGAVNPAFAKDNPITAYDNHVKNQEDSRKIAKTIRQACGLKYFNVSLPNLSNLERVNMRRYAASSLSSALSSLCNAPETKAQIENNFGMLNIISKKGVSSPQIQASSMALTMTYDFSLTDAPSPSLMSAQLRDSLGTLAKNVEARLKQVESPDYDQDNLEAEMDALVKKAVQDARTGRK